MYVLLLQSQTIPERARELHKFYQCHHCMIVIAAFIHLKSFEVMISETT